MDEDRARTVREWDSRSVEGHGGLHDLADGEFSGVIETDRGSIRAFMTNGRIVGITGGDVGDLDGTGMTAYAAPDDALPVLFAMEERGGEPRAQYYTEETPLAEVNRTLEEGGFTGYVELSENVLSGDYYVVYHGGRSSSVAFVGNNSRLLTGDEAFERAADEVGIYDVVDADVSVIDVPGPGGGGPGGGTATGADHGGTGPGGGTGTTTADAGTREDTGTAADSDDASGGGRGTTRADTGATTGGDTTGETVDGPDESGSSAAGGTADGGDTVGAGSSGGGTESGGRSADLGRHGSGSSTGGSGPYGSGEEIRVGAGLGVDEGSDDEDGGAEEDKTRPDDGTDGVEGGTGSGVDAHAGGDSAPARADDPEGERAEPDEGGPSEQTEPDESEPSTAPSSADGTSRDADASGADASEPAESETDEGTPTGPDADPESAGETTPGGNEPALERSEQSENVGAGGPADAETDARSDTADAGRRNGAAAASGSDARRQDGRASEPEPTRERLASELREAREALERVRAERDGYRDDAERLRERVTTLEARIEALEAEDDADEGEEDDADGTAVDPDAAERSVEPSEALANTNLFVRYESKADPTLEDAHGGSVDPATVNGNLRIERHTQFETGGVVVDGEPFESFLTSTFEYEFVEWVIRDLLYELRSTGSRESMEAVYDAIPAIDRVQFDGGVRVGTDDGAGTDPDEEATEVLEFDVIFRDQMGGPLLVANLHQGRDPTGGAAVTTVAENARTVAATDGTLGGAFVVTTSYYEKPALESVSSATGGGFLSRTRKKSYVKMKRNRGFHLCLVEARDGDFNLRIPEL